MLPRPNPDSQLAPQHLRVKWSGSLLDWRLHARLYSRYNHMYLGFHAWSSKLGYKPHFPSQEPRLGTDAWHLRGRWTVIHEVMSLLSDFSVGVRKVPNKVIQKQTSPRLPTGWVSNLPGGLGRDKVHYRSHSLAMKCSAPALSSFTRNSNLSDV